MLQAEALRITTTHCSVVMEVRSPKSGCWPVYISLSFRIGYLLPSNGSLTL